MQSSPFFLSQPANDAVAREGTGARCAAARERDWISRAAAHLTPVASRASIAGWKRKKGLLCSLLGTRLTKLLEISIKKTKTKNLNNQEE